MKKDKSYRQCVLVNGARETNSWVENKLAIEGKEISIDKEPGWVIRSVSGFCLSSSLVESLKDQNRHYRSQKQIICKIKI